MKRLSALLIALALMFTVPAHAGIRFGQGTKTITTAATPLALTATSTDITSLTVCGDVGNTGKVAIAQAPVAAAGSEQGIILSPGGCAVIESHGANPVKFDLSTFKGDVTVSGEKISFFYITEEN